MSTTFMPPANLKDFDRSATHKEDLYQAWHQRIQKNVAFDPGQPALSALRDVLCSTLSSL